MRKFKKARKGVVKSSSSLWEAVSNSGLKYGEYGLIAKEGGRLTARQLEAGRRVLSRGEGLRVWVRVYPDIPVTKKSSGVRMGKGKGGISHRIARVKPGSVIFEVKCQYEKGHNIMEVLESASKKLPIATVKRSFM